MQRTHVGVMCEHVSIHVYLSLKHAMRIQGRTAAHGTYRVLLQTARFVSSPGSFALRDADGIKGVRDFGTERGAPKKRVHRTSSGPRWPPRQGNRSVTFAAAKVASVTYRPGLRALGPCMRVKRRPVCEKTTNNFLWTKATSSAE
jgi:hypothetical protein